MLRTLYHTCLDFLLPPLCPGCGAVTGRDGGLCADCWSRIAFVSAPYCQRCGLAFDYPVDGMSECAACVAQPPDYARCRAVFLYDDASRALLLGLKHGDRTDWAPAFGDWMARAGAELLASADLIAPVPLHRWRLFHRRYNQAALLAQCVGSARGIQVVPDLLHRHRRTASQGHLSVSGRRRNVAGAFAVDPVWQHRVQGARVLLIDDVMTTGATLEACTKVLLRQGASAVDALVLARVGRPRPLA